MRKMIMLLVFCFLVPAVASADAPLAAQSAGGGGMSLFLMFGIFLLFMYFGIWRPQTKRTREQRTMLDGLAKGDEVVTAGGILGKIVKLADQFIVLSLNDSVEMTVQKTSIVTVLPKGTMKSI